ncbi:hypothetical protein Tco_1559248, partial [Tanacetum coccineum]
FLPPVLLLVIVVVSVAVVVVVVVIVVISLVVFPLPFIPFTNSGSPTLNGLLNQFMGHVDGIMQSCRTHQGQLMETIVVCLTVISFQIQSLELLLHLLDFSCWAVFRSHHRLEFSPWNMVSIDEP